MANYFGDSGGVRRDNRFPGRHSLQKHDAEALLNAGQTKDVGSIVFGGELVNAHVADPGDEPFDRPARASCRAIDRAPARCPTILTSNSGIRPRSNATARNNTSKRLRG